MAEPIINNLEFWVTAQTLKTSNRGRTAANQRLYGVNKLRELILELAVRGKLVNQDPRDEPASILLEKIAKEKKFLIKEGKIRKQTPFPILSKDEILYILPLGWQWAHLGEIGNIFNGNSISAKDKEEKYTNIAEGLPFLATKDIEYGWEQLNYDNGIVIPENEKGFSVAHSGAVFICAEGGSAGKKCGIATKDVCFGNKLFAIELFGNTISKYLLANYLTPTFYSQFSKNMTGIIGGISLLKFIHLIVPIPPLAEQHRIVAKVDELMALCDLLEQQQTNSNAAHEVLVETLLDTLTHAAEQSELEQAWNRIANHFDVLFNTEHSIDRLKQTILQLAVMGKLVPQNPGDEPASELLKKIAKEKARLVKEGKIKKQNPLSEIDKAGEPFAIPKSWKWVPWGELLANDDGAFKRGPFGSSLKKDMFVDSGYKVYEQYCPINDDCSFERYFISKEMFEDMKTFAVKANDYLISCSGATLGRITQVPKNFNEGIINQALLRVRINHTYVDKYFFKLLFRSPYFQKLIVDNSTGSAIPNVKGVKELKIMPFPLLPLNEQRMILVKVDELFAICDALKAKINEAQGTQLKLANALVEGALA